MAHIRFSNQSLTLFTRPSGPHPRPSLRVTLLLRPRSPPRHLPPRRPRPPSNRSQTYQIPSIPLRMADHVIMANVNSQTQVLSLSNRTRSWGGPRRDGSFSFFFFPLKSIFLFFNPPSLLFSPLHGTLTDFRKASSWTIACGRVARVKFGDGRPTVN